MGKLAIQLERHPDPHELERAYVLYAEDGSILTVAGPDISCNIESSRCSAALKDLGFNEREFSVGSVVQVDAATLQMYVRNWGRDSRQGLVREAREVCENNGVVLSSEAMTERFKNAGDRELAAALWFLWLDGERTGVCLGNCSPDASYCRDEVCQIGAFVFYLDEEGRVTFDEFTTVAAAEERVSEIDKQWHRAEESLSRFLRISRA